MAITSGFFNSANGDRLYNAAQIGRYLQYLVSDGVYAYDSTSLQVLANDGMEVEVQAGRAMLDHHFMDNDAPITFTLSAGGSQDRIDAVIMYVDMTERACGITVKAGTPAASPTAPALTRTDVRKEYMLAKVRVPKLASTITQANITDTRADTSVCGWVTGIIEQVDTAALFIQWQTAYEEAYARLGDYLAAQQAAWETFFASVTEDIALPAPSLDDAGKAMTVKADGSGYELQHVVAGAPANLLDNSNFANPVNQRGKSTYSLYGYTIDRWRSSGGSMIVSLEDGAVSIASTNASGYLELYQPLPDGSITAGKKYALGAKLADGNVYAASVEAPSSGGASAQIPVAGLGYLQLICTAAGDYRFTIGVGAKKTMAIVWAALYEGEYTAETLPTYQAKGYGAELQECRRYYRQSWYGAIEDMSASGSVPFIRAKGGANTQMAVNWHDPMRITPTIKIYSPSTKAENYIRDWIGSTDKPVGGAGYASPCGFCLVLKDSGTVEGTDYVFHYTASADL